MTNHSTKSANTLSKQIDLSNCTKEDIRLYYHNAFDAYEDLFSSIKDESSYYICPDRLRLPLIFYYAHTAAVFENKLVLADVIRPNERINKEFDTIFETGVDEMSWDSIEHFRMGGKFNWPTFQQCKEFRQKCRKLVNLVIDREELALPITPESLWWAILMGIEHELIHFETSSVLIRQLPVDMVSKPDGWVYGPTTSPVNANLNNRMLKMIETEVKLGKPIDYPSFGWDNEYGELNLKLDPFEASEFKVTNEEFLEFVLSGGYESQSYWSPEGWDWRCFKDTRHPRFWVCPLGCLSSCGSALSDYSHCQGQWSDSDIKYFENRLEGDNFGYKLRLMFDVITMPRNWPVEVNYHEAKAFCKWKGDGYRILSEAEHNAIRGIQVPEMNINLVYSSSTPVDMYPPNEKGFHDVFGNVWEWVEDHFNSLQGGFSDYLYDDFSSPCYDGRHNLIMGGSWASMGDLASPFGRYMFRRHFYQHCGFRLVRSLPVANKRMNPQIKHVIDRIFIINGFNNDTVNTSLLDEKNYEINYHRTMNSQYIYDSDLNLDTFEKELHYQFVEPKCNWYKPFSKEINDVLGALKIERKTAIHVGASMGRFSFELARSFEQVYALDFCSKFLDVALKLQAKGSVSIKLEDKSVVNLTIEENSKSANVLIKQLTWLPNEIPESELVLFTMIDRVSNTRSWLRRFKEIVKPSGLLIIYSRDSKFNGEYLVTHLKEFDLLSEKSIIAGDAFTVWKLNHDYAKENL